MNRAIAVFDGKKIRGLVYFTEDRLAGTVTIDVDLVGLKKNAKHGFHIHEYGDMSDHCDSMCAHFNPYGKPHGGQDSPANARHVGDLGNLVTDDKGACKMQMVDKLISLHGTKTNIIGRGLIIHADEDDLGEGGHETSLETGNSGKRIACAVIGHAKLA
jgi:Cu-Zn family superoxide dismutase